jgi:hypothetical protein
VDNITLLWKNPITACPAAAEISALLITRHECDEIVARGTRHALFLAVRGLAS